MAEIAVLCQKSVAILELGLWAILSTANVENTLKQSDAGKTIPSSSNCAQMLLPGFVDSVNMRSYDMFNTVLNETS